MVNIRTFNPTLRAVGVIGAVAALVGGVTFAALTSTATLTENTISSATATLEVDNTENGLGFSSSDTGYLFTGLVPGGAPSIDHFFSLKNSGTTDLDVTVYATIVAPGGIGTLDKSKVKVTFSNLDDIGSATYSLATLEAVFNDVPNDGDQVLGVALIPAGITDNFSVSVKLDPGAVTGTGPVDVTGFSLVFTGTNDLDL